MNIESLMDKYLSDVNENKTQYKVGDVIKFDANAIGVTPKIKTGKILSVARAMGSKGNPNAGFIFRVKLDNGTVLEVDDFQIM